MSAYYLVVTPAAKDDLKNIYRYGLNRWGKAQSDSYVAVIKDQFWSLTQQPFIGSNRPELLSNIRALTVQSHIVFYRVAAQQVEIIRLLHHRQDPQRYVK